MTWRASLAGPIGALCLATAGPACTVQSSGGVVITDGTLALDWTINGTRDPNQCVQGGAKDFRVEIYAAGGAFMGEYAAACTTFATSVSLPGGRYTGTAHLADAAGNPRTTAINVAPWTITSGAVLSVGLDFPASSFIETRPTSVSPTIPGSVPSP